MALSRADQRRILREDAKRRNAREASEIADLLGFAPTPDETVPRGTMLVRADARAIGATTALTVRASQSSWLDSRGYLRGRVVGVAPGTEDTSDGTPTVRVIHADGTSEVRTVASFRAPREATTVREARPRREASVPEMANAAKYGTHILTGE